MIFIGFESVTQNYETICIELTILLCNKSTTVHLVGSALLKPYTTMQNKNTVFFSSILKLRLTIFKIQNAIQR